MTSTCLEVGVHTQQMILLFLSLAVNLVMTFVYPCCSLCIYFCHVLAVDPVLCDCPMA